MSTLTVARRVHKWVAPTSPASVFGSEWGTVPDEPPPDEILALLDDEYAQAILRHSRTTAMSAKDLSDVCGVSISTIYRRADRLVDSGLLAERRIVDGDGHYFSLYEARLDELTVRLTDDGFDVMVTEKPTGDLADRFTEMWEGL